MPTIKLSQEDQLDIFDADVGEMSATGKYKIIEESEWTSDRKTQYCYIIFQNNEDGKKYQWWISSQC